MTDEVRALQSKAAKQTAEINRLHNQLSEKRHEIRRLKSTLGDACKNKTGWRNAALREMGAV